VLAGLVTKKNAISPLMLGTLVVGFIGVVLILQPTISKDQWWHGLVGLLAGAIAALAYLQVASLGKAGEPEIRIVFYFALGSLIAGIVSVLFTGISMPGWAGFKWVLPIGISALLGQLMMTRAYARGSTLLVANLQYAGIIYSSLFGVWVFDDKLSSTAWIGIALVFVGGIGASVVRARAR
jgi:drug/metabolite transporter (DMT)-like permease